ncbi:hypothetical protein EXIGLDRAFT_783655 [Exidia glandulosa HHB12029]|uniref:Uncharacterized protein n=1 Tax=Exidia glandulosa HHB12029 TaxID=1314781 RepID=A0A166MXZ2_EXIGL|nr:hypothetical protein EXIGLDRAFT_783655 [Exidia glandulosa HHB12029]
MDLPNAELLERIKANADSMLEQAATFDEAARVPTVTGINKPSFVLPFIIYPEALAHEELGFYWYRKAKTTSTGKIEDIYSPLHKSIEHHAKAAEIYPRDEEMRAEVLWHQLVSMFRCGRPLRETLPVCDDLEQAVKDKQKIWRGSANMDGGRTDKRYQIFVWFAEDARKAVEKGELTLESPAMPDQMNTIIE